MSINARTGEPLLMQGASGGTLANTGRAHYVCYMTQGITHGSTWSGIRVGFNIPTEPRSAVRAWAADPELESDHRKHHRENRVRTD